MISLRKLWQITNIALLATGLADTMWLVALSIEINSVHHFHLGLIYAMALPIICLWFGGKRKYSDLREFFHAQSWPPRIPRLACPILSASCSLIFLLALVETFWFVSLTGATCLVLCGNSEAGERAFAAIPDPTHIKENITLANITKLNIGVENKDLVNVENKVKIVENVYGKKSAQVAHLHENIAKRYLNEFYPEEAKKHFQLAGLPIPEPLESEAASEQGKKLRMLATIRNSPAVEFRDLLRDIPLKMPYIFLIGIIALRIGEWMLLKLLIFRWVRDYKFSEYPDISLFGKLAVAEFLVGNTFESDSYSRLSVARLNDDD